MRRLSDPNLILKEVDRLFDRLVHSGWRTQSVWTPTVDLYEENGEYVLEVDLPGVDPDEVEITIQGHMISISGRRTCSRSVVAGGFLYSERNYGEFRRVLMLPSDAITTNIRKSFENGILKIYFPKRKRAAIGF